MRPPEYSDHRPARETEIGLAVQPVMAKVCLWVFGVYMSSGFGKFNPGDIFYEHAHKLSRVSGWNGGDRHDLSTVDMDIRPSSGWSALCSFNFSW